MHSKNLATKSIHSSRKAAAEGCLASAPKRGFGICGLRFPRFVSTSHFFALFVPVHITRTLRGFNERTNCKAYKDRTGVMQNIIWNAQYCQTTCVLISF